MLQGKNEPGDLKENIIACILKPRSAGLKLICPLPIIELGDWRNLSDAVSKFLKDRLLIMVDVATHQGTDVNM